MRKRKLCRVVGWGRSRPAPGRSPAPETGGTSSRDRIVVQFNCVCTRRFTPRVLRAYSLSRPISSAPPQLELKTTHMVSTALLSSSPSSQEGEA